MLYVRMLLMMLVSLYTSRVVLQALGVEDFGIYSVVGGIVVLFSFINNAMVSSTQRFLNFELGRGNEHEARRVFSASFNVHLGICIVLIILAETIGLILLDKYIQIPNGREEAAFWTYQFAIVHTCIGIIRTPYNAAIIAHERMSFFAYISIIEGGLNLLVVYLLSLFAIDRLILYSFLTVAVLLIVTLAYYGYCRRNFLMCRYSIVKDKPLYRQLISFSGWSLFGSIATVGASQGLNVLINVFYGVVANAAMGIANQVNSAISRFVSSFQTAFNPQIFKSYAADRKLYFLSLIINGSRYSYLLLFILSLPVFVFCEECLSLWLHTIPPYAVIFCRIMILYSLLDTMQNPLWISVQATGKIKHYQILMSILFVAVLPISFLCLRYGLPPQSVLLVRVLMQIVIYVTRIVFLQRLYGFPIRRYLSDMFSLCLPATVASLPIPFLLSNRAHSVLEVTIVFLITIGQSLIIVYLLGMKRNEKGMILKLIKKRFNRIIT